MSNSLRFYVNNLVDQATITASNENALFPASNLQDQRRTKVFRSTTNSDSIVFDFQETSEINSVMVVDEPFNGFGFTTITLELNGTNTWGSPAFTQSITVSTEHGVGYAEFNTQSYRFARIVLNSTLGYCELSKIYIGKNTQIGTDRSVQYGWSYQDRDISRVTENRYGQKFSDIILRQRLINFSMNLLSKDEMDNIFEIYDYCGITKPLFIRIGCDEISNEKRRYAGMFYMNNVPTITNTSFNRYSLSFQLEEAT